MAWKGKGALAYDLARELTKYGKNLVVVVAVHSENSQDRGAWLIQDVLPVANRSGGKDIAGLCIYCREQEYPLPEEAEPKRTE
ncbi:MAG: hypothetical protein EOM66_10750, partial [Clostridia bacterium]|nr:hypothetical protein [Clostridia bacterium]